MIKVTDLLFSPQGTSVRFGADVIIGGIGLAPGGVIISSFWFFGGRELVFNYGENIGELMKDGINPGLPVNQPFK